MAARKIPTVPQRALANALERHREAAGLSREDVGSSLEWSSMKLWRIETSRVTVSAGDVRELALLYHLDDAGAQALVDLARQARRPGWWKGMSQSLPEGFSVHLELESAARAIRTLRRPVRPRPVADRGLRPRGAQRPQRRQHPRPDRAPGHHPDAPPADPGPRQPAAARDMGSPGRVGDPPRGRRPGRHARQLARLGEISGSTTATLQVLPFSAGAHMAAYGCFSLFDPSEPAFPVTASAPTARRVP